MKNKKIKILIGLILILIAFKFINNYIDKRKFPLKTSVLLGEITPDNKDYLKFLKEYMIRDGGVSTEVYIEKNGVVKRNNIILSESQGLVMEIATYLRDKELFKNSYRYLNRNMKLFNSLYSWKIDENSNEKSKATATIDDLRIYKALLNANFLWGGYQDDILKLEKKIKKALLKGYFIDFLDSGQKGDEFSIFYIDGEALNCLEKSDSEFREVKENIKNLLKKAKINKETPFYKEVYLINEEEFKFQENSDMLNTLLIIYNKKILDMDIKEEYEQLRNILLRDGAIYSKYNFQGIALTNIESSSIYGYFYIISFLQNDKEILEKIESRLNVILGEKKNFNGMRIPISNNEKVYSFDLLILLLASMRRER